MPRFAANVSTMFPDLPVAERFAAARAIGFQAVEYPTVNMPHLFEVCDRLGYHGWIGCEYRPMTTAAEGLSWGRPYGLGRHP